jgi:hypothetical protein
LRAALAGSSNESEGAVASARISASVARRQHDHHQLAAQRAARMAQHRNRIEERRGAPAQTLGL